MAHWKKRFPSKYLQASDLDVPIDATISHMVEEQIGTGDHAEKKPVLYFREKWVKGVVMNQTRSEAVERIAGTPDDDEWVGVRVRLQKGRTKFQGKTVDCIDIVAPPAKRPPIGKPVAPTEPDDPMPTADDGSEEPF
jgi:hypothetical protein